MRLFFIVVIHQNCSSRKRKFRDLSSVFSVYLSSLVFSAISSVLHPHAIHVYLNALRKKCDLIASIL